MNIIGVSQQPRWSASLCSCGGDFGTCCITCWLPCITFGRIAEVLDEGRSSCGAQGCIYGLLMLISCNCLYSCTYRSKLRAKFGLPSSGCCDFCVHCCCESCALCQLHEELKNRGLDPSIGWIGPPDVPPMVHVHMNYN